MTTPCVRVYLVVHRTRRACVSLDYAIWNWPVSLQHEGREEASLPRVSGGNKSDWERVSAMGRGDFASETFRKGLMG
jgi:hypothetical protein